MSLPAIITAGSAVMVAANPTVAVPVVAAYAANAAIRAQFRLSEYEVARDQVNKLQDIVSKLTLIAEKLDTISDRIYDADLDVNLAEAVQRKPYMPDELHLHVNTDRKEYTDGERWTAT